MIPFPLRLVSSSPEPEIIAKHSNIRPRRMTMSRALGVQFMSVALIVFFGKWPTGFDKVHGFLYVPVVALTFSGITVICPGLIFWKKVGLM
jgi:hypothetical protein